MAIKNITPTTNILATSTCAGAIRARRRITPTTNVSATSTVSGAVSTQIKSYGIVGQKRFIIFATTAQRFRNEGEARFDIRRVMTTHDLVSQRD